MWKPENSGKISEGNETECVLKEMGGRQKEGYEGVKQGRRNKEKQNQEEEG
jgi:hypothetical protein